jgi:hypothetical protein
MAFSSYTFDASIWVKKEIKDLKKKMQDFFEKKAGFLF